MGNLTIKATVLAALGLASIQAMATGFVNLPTAGFTISGAKSAYTIFNPTGAFGSGDSTPPSTTANNTGAVFPANMTVAPPPYSSFSLIASNTRTVVMPAPYAGSNANVASVTDAVFRGNVSGTNAECVYAVFVHMNNAPLANGENWALSDIARGGFATKGNSVDAAYYYQSINAEVVFRAGRAHTAVRHMIGEPNQPLTSGAPAASTPITSTGKAAISTNWVDFTTDANYLDPDGSTLPDTAVNYVHTTCTTATPTLSPDAIRLRSTGQEGQQQIEVKIPGYAPPGSTINVY